MKKTILALALVVTLFACTNPSSKQEASAVEAPAPIEHIYKPTYTDNFKIGDQKNVLLAEQLHQAIFAKDFATLENALVDTVLFSLEDGSTIKGKAAAMEYMKNAFAQMTVKNYSLTGAVPIVGDNGHQWVIMFDKADVETPDGKTIKLEWMDSFRFENGKVVHMNGYVKSPK
jgi:ketosteroid isomerase-like protein